MKTLSNPSIDKNDLANLITKSQEYIEILNNLVSIQALDRSISEKRNSTSEKVFSPDELRELENKISNVKMCFENDSTIILELPEKPAAEFTCQQMGFRSQETKTWKMLMEIISTAPYTFNFGIAYTYPDKSKKNRQKCRDYDAKWKLLDELNKKLLMFFKKEFNWNFPRGYKLYINVPSGKDGDKGFKFIVGPPSSQINAVPMNDIEKRLMSLDESSLENEIRNLNDDFSIDSYVHNEPPETLVAAINLGVKNFNWTEERISEILQNQFA